MPNQGPAHWSKDFVEHLRTVHFTLIALCVGLIVLASFPSKSEIQVAHEQASEILEVTNTWKEGFLETMAVTTIKASIVGDDVDRYVVSVGTPQHAKFDLIFGTNDWLARLQFASPSWIIDNPIPSELLPDVSSNSGPELRVRVPSSLMSFQRLWDALHPKGHITVPTVPSECFAGVFFRLNGGPEPTDFRRFESIGCMLSPQKSLHDATALTVSFRRVSEERYRELSQPSQTKWNFEFAGSLPKIPIKARGQGIVAVGGEAVLPVRNVEQIDFDGLKALIQRSDKWKEKDGRSFRDAFRELAAVDEPFANADISSAERILDADAKRTGEAFEAAGLKIPAEVAVRCGVLLVLGVQLYLLIHLREFGNRLDREAGYEVAWIGVYSSKLARVMLFVSLLLLPACTVVLLSYRGLNMTEHKRIAWAALVASNAASLALSYFIFKVLPQPPAPVPASPAAEPLS